MVEEFVRLYNDIYGFPILLGGTGPLQGFHERV